MKEAASTAQAANDELLEKEFDFAQEKKLENETQVIPNHDHMKEVESEAQAANDELLEKEFDLAQEKKLENETGRHLREHRGNHHGGRHGKDHHGKWGKHGGRGRHGRKNGPPRRHGCAIFGFIFFGILMGSYLCTFKRFCHSLKQLTDLKAVEATTENMDDEEKVATLNLAVQKKTKKCKKVVKKQIANAPQMMVSPSPVPMPGY